MKMKTEFRELTEFGISKMNSENFVNSVLTLRLRVCAVNLILK